jgi:hypothetical protein
MFHMLTCFNLKPDIDIGDFRTAYTEFVDHMRGMDLVDHTGPFGQRQSTTIMDTDGERDHQYFVTMSFRDRAQSDAAVAHIQRHDEPTELFHKAAYSKVENPIFICWQDMD